MLKRLFYTGAIVALMATPALADNSTSTITQSNTGNDATVDQSGSLDGASSIITQSGADNEATVTQADPGVMVGTPTNTSTILQSGNNNSATVDQKQTSQVVSIEQISDNNEATVYQGSDDLSMGPTSNNSATVYQAGGGNNKAFVDQRVSTDDMVFINQIGTNAEAMADQSIVGDNNMGMVDQMGDANFAEVLQPGDDNLSVVEQDGSGNEAWVLQSGNNNMSTILQDLTDNDATVNQVTSSNTSSVNQLASTSGTVRINQ